MALRVIKCSSIDELQAILQGAVKLKPILRGVYGLIGKTLEFTLPAEETVTFVKGASNDGFLTFKEIADQLKEAVTGLAVSQKDGAMYLRSDSGVEITGGTARADFGFSGTAKGVVYGPPDSETAPRFIHAYAVGDAHVLIVEEAAEEA